LKDRVDPGDERLQLCATDLQRELAPVLASNVQKIERDEGRLLGAALGPQRREVAVAVRLEHHGLALEQGVVDRQGSHRVGDSRQLVGEVGSISGPEGDAIGGLAASIRKPSCLIS
jgi:hypothetical protein